MATKSFIDILEERIRKDLRNETGISAEQDLASATASVKLGAKAESLETWLATNIAKSEFGRSQKGYRSYTQPRVHSPSRAASARPSPRQPTDQEETLAETLAGTVANPVEANQTKRQMWKFTTEEYCALEVLRREFKIDLKDDFTVSELKSAWRKAALHTHPDRFSQADQRTQREKAIRFSLLTSTFDILEQAVRLSTQAEAA